MNEGRMQTRNAIHSKFETNRRQTAIAFRRPWSYIAALFILGSAIIHTALIPPRTQQHVLYGMILAAVALVQLALGIALIRRPSGRIAWLGILICLGLILSIIAFQATPLPLGAHPWEPIGFDDADSTGIGTMVLAALMLFVSLWSSAGPTTPRRRAYLAYVPATVVLFLLTFFGVASAVNSGPVGANMSAPVPAGRAAVPVDSLREPPGNQPIKSFTLVAGVKDVNGRQMFAYNGEVPGPELRVTQGDRLRVTLINHLPVATSVHWHGVSLPNAEDGVAGVTQDAVPPGSSYVYEFVARDAGTFLYHSHQDSYYQVLRGLYGALVVLPRTSAVADRDYALVVHEAPSGGNSLRDNFGELVVGAPANQAPAINGVTRDLHLEARQGERVRLRVIGVVQSDMKVSSIPDMMHASPQELVLLGVNYRVVALDGFDLNAPPLIGPARLRIGIGQRYDLEFTMPPSGAVRLVDLQGAETVTIGDGPPPAVPDLGRLPVFDLTNYGSPGPAPIALDSRFDITYPVILDSHFGFRQGRLELVHTINGQNSPMGAQFMVRVGQLVRLHIDNIGDEIHTMHLHGHHFTVLAHNGQPLRGSPVRLDSLLVEPHETWDIAFMADNPGLWMFHCHVLIHADFGMSAMVMYEGVTTPYEIGARSGNRPE